MASACIYITKPLVTHRTPGAREVNDPTFAELVADIAAERCGVVTVVENPVTRLAWYRALVDEALW